MENYPYTSYPESGGSSPRSREIDFENPQPWEDQHQPTGNTNTYKVKLMCSYGGKIHPRPHDNQLAYVGGETKILSVDRSIKFSALVAKLSAVCDGDVCFKYQLPGEDLDALISVTDDDDLDHMMNEYDRLNKASSKPARLRLFLFPVSAQTPSVTSTHSFGSTEGRSERERFVDALNSGPVTPVTPIQSSTPPSHGDADFLFGSEKGVPPAPVTVTVPVAKVRDLPIADPAIRHHDPDILGDRGIGEDRIQKHIQDLRMLRIAEDQQQNPYRRQSDDNIVASGYAGDYYVQRTVEKVAPTTLPGSVPSPAPGYQISGGYMAPAPSSMYHAPMATPVTGSVGHGQGQGQGYYAVQRMPPEVYRDQPVYNAVQPVAPQPVFPPLQQPPQKIVTHSEGIRVVQSPAGMTEAGYGQVAYDSGVARHVYYTAQGTMVAPHQPPPPLQPQPPVQPIAHQYQAVAAGLSQDGKVIAPTKVTQGSI